MWSKKSIEYLDRYYQPCGECMFCGHKDKRHRLWDAIIALTDAGHDMDEILSQYPDESVAHIEAVQMVRPYHRGGFIPDEPITNGGATMKDLAMALGSTESEAKQIDTGITAMVNGFPKSAKAT